jgi:hypothetical protein
VVVSDLPVHREIGGHAAEYCATDQTDSWVSTIGRLLREREINPQRWYARRESGFRQAAKYTWSANANSVMHLYAELTGAHLQQPITGAANLLTGTAL